MISLHLFLWVQFVLNAWSALGQLVWIWEGGHTKRPFECAVDAVVAVVLACFAAGLLWA